LPADLFSAALVVSDLWARPARFRSGLFFRGSSEHGGIHQNMWFYGGESGAK